MDTYEKKYKKALLKARDAKQNTESAVTIGILEEIFPELRESNDERIRKEIIDFITSSNKYGTNERCEVCLNWLEKQGEHHIACSEEQMKVLDEVLNFAANHESPYWNDYIFGTLNSLIRQLKN